MTVMLYPTKTSPKGYRVQDKVLNVQKYFPFSKFGTPKKAEKKPVNQDKKNDLETGKERQNQKSARKPSVSDLTK